jgi:hypothetical protein
MGSISPHNLMVFWHLSTKGCMACHPTRGILPAQALDAEIFLLILHPLKVIQLNMRSLLRAEVY